MTQPASRVVMFVEDPGAANCFAPLAQALADAGVPATLYATGLALDALRARGLDPLISGSADVVAGWKRARPDWLLVGTSENLDSAAFALVEAARAAGIASAALIDAAANAAHRFRGRSEQALRHAPEWLLVPDQWAAREFVRLGHRQDRVVEVGHPHYDFLRSERARLERVGREALRARLLPNAGTRRALVFVSEISTGLDAAQFQRSAQYTLAGRGGATGRTDIVVEELLDAIGALQRRGAPRPWCVLRRHPKESPQALAAMLPEFDQVSSGGTPLELVFAADLVVGMSSMALVEAHLLGVPALSILPRELERDWLPMVRAGVIDCATERAGLLRLLEKHLAAAGTRTRPPGDGPGPSSAQRILEVLGVRAAVACGTPQFS